MKIYIGSDHTAIDVRREIGEFIENLGYEVIDLGGQTNPASYSEFGIKVAQTVAANPGSMGIVICGTGIGISIAANKVKGIRAALVDRVENAPLVREHNDANVLALGARTTSVAEMKQIIKAFLMTDFAGGRHQARVDYITTFEENQK